MDLATRAENQLPANVKSMLDVVKLTENADPRLEILRKNVFGKVVLTKSYDQAM